MTEPQVELAPEHARFPAFVGTWAGTTRTWLDPSAPPEQCETKASFQLLLGGLFLQESYEGTVMGRFHRGYRTYGFDKQAGEAFCTWIDNFHMGSSVMLLKGTWSEGRLVLRGDYAAGPERWGWRTELELADDAECLIRQYNITPAGEEMLGIETRLRRLPA